jgi:transposase
MKRGLAAMACIGRSPDAVTQASLFRSGELTPVWVPDDAHEAIRDLCRARQAAMEALRRARQQVLSFLLRHGRVYSGGGHWKAFIAWYRDYFGLSTRCGRVLSRPRSRRSFHIVRRC